MLSPQIILQKAKIVGKIPPITAGGREGEGEGIRSEERGCSVKQELRTCGHTQHFLSLMDQQ